MQRPTLIRVLSTAVTLLILTGVASAGEVRSFFGKTPTDEEVYGALAPKPRMRGLNLQVASPEPASAAFEIKFEFDSAELTPAATETLNTIGRVLSRPDLSAERYIIEGHTDNLGTEVYNQDLSLRRAQSVREYLMSNFTIDPERIAVIGKGESEPFDPNDPAAAVNRRVQISHAGPQ